MLRFGGDCSEMEILHLRIRLFYEDVKWICHDLDESPRDCNRRLQRKSHSFVSTLDQSGDHFINTISPILARLFHHLLCIYNILDHLPLQSCRTGRTCHGELHRGEPHVVCIDYTRALQLVLEAINDYHEARHRPSHYRHNLKDQMYFVNPLQYCLYPTIFPLQSSG